MASYDITTSFDNTLERLGRVISKVSFKSTFAALPHIILNEKQFGFIYILKCTCVILSNMCRGFRFTDE